MSRFRCGHVAGNCTRCAECCKFEAASSLTEKEEESILISIFRKTGFIYPHGLSNPGLDIQSYEYERFLRLAEAKGLKIELQPKKVLYDTKRQLTIVFDWLLPCKVCPFLKEDKGCSIYQERFDICRLFPEIEKDLPEVEKRHAVASQLIQQGEIIMPSAESYPALVKLALLSEAINFDSLVEIKEFED